MSTSALLVMLLSGSLSLYGDLSVGGGVETNLNHAPLKEDRAAAGYFEATAALGLNQEWTHAAPWIELGYAYTLLPAYTDFSSHTGSLSLGSAFDLRKGFGVRVSSFASLSRYGDTARDSVLGGGSVSLGYRAPRVFRASLRFSPSYRKARDDVFSAMTLRANALLSFLPARWLDLTLGYGVGVSDVVLYTTLTTPIESRGRGRRSLVSTFGETDVAVRERATTQTLLGTLTVFMPRGLYAVVSYTGSWVGAPTASYVDHVIAGQLGLTL